MAFQSMIHVKMMWSVKKPSTDMNKNTIAYAACINVLGNLGGVLGHLNEELPLTS